MSNSENLNEYGLREYSFEIGHIDDSSETVAIVGIEYSSVSDTEKFYRKEDVDPLLAKRDPVISWQQVQIYYDLSVRAGDDDGDFYETLSVEEQKKILPHLLAWYSPTWFARNFPHNEEDLPKRVKPSKHFLSFDPAKGLSICVEYLIDEDIVLDTEKFKKTLTEIADDAEGQFSDGWGESFEQHFFKIGKQIYYPKADSDIHQIVTNVGFSESLMVRWKSIKEIEHSDWMLAYDNDASNMLFREELHKRRIEREIKLMGLTKDTETINMLRFVEANRDKFFVAS